MLALVESREFRPPKDLQIQIDRELAMIREQWGDSIPEVLLEYRDPWDGRIAIDIYADTSLLRDTDTILPFALDSALRHFGATIHRESYWTRHNWTITPNEPWYPPVAVDSFAGVPGISAMVLNVPHSVGYYTSFREVTDTGVYWYMGSDCGWLLRMHAFRVRRNRVEFVDEYNYCNIPVIEALENGPAWFREMHSRRVGIIRGDYYRQWPEGK